MSDGRVEYLEEMRRLDILPPLTAIACSRCQRPLEPHEHRDGRLGEAHDSPMVMAR